MNDETPSAGMPGDVKRDAEGIESDPGSGKPERRGRGKSPDPRISHDNRKIRFRVFAEEAEELKARAAKAGMTVSDFCRRAISKKRILSRYGEMAPRIAEVHEEQARLGNLFKDSFGKKHLDHSESDKRNAGLLLKSLGKNQEKIRRVLEAMRKPEPEELE